MISYYKHTIFWEKGSLKGKKGTTYNSAVRREALKGFGVNFIIRCFHKFEKWAACCKIG
jgi:hypothetical protein